MKNVQSVFVIFIAGVENEIFVYGAAGDRKDQCDAPHSDSLFLFLFDRFVLVLR